MTANTPNITVHDNVLAYPLNTLIRYFYHNPSLIPQKTKTQRLQTWINILTIPIRHLISTWAVTFPILTIPYLVQLLFAPSQSPSASTTGLWWDIGTTVVFLTALDIIPIQTRIRHDIRPHLYSPFFQRSGFTSLWNKRDTLRVVRIHVASLIIPTLLTILLLVLVDLAPANPFQVIAQIASFTWYGLYVVTLIKSVIDVKDDYTLSQNLARFVLEHGVIATMDDSQDGVTISYHSISVPDDMA